MLPAGGIKALSVKLPSHSTPSPSNISSIKLFVPFIILVFGIWLISVFYLRIKARAIDTQPAFVVAVLAGFLFAGSRLLTVIYNLDLTLESLISSNFVQDLFLVGFLGAISSILFFVLTTVSDSVTRQHWPSKLKAWDLARRGFFKNKPVGRSVICGLTIAGILAGTWAILVHIIPNTRVLPTTELASLGIEFPSLVVGIENLFGSLLLIIGILW